MNGPWSCHIIAEVILYCNVVLAGQSIATAWTLVFGCFSHFSQPFVFMIQLNSCVQFCFTCCSLSFLISSPFLTVLVLISHVVSPHMVTKFRVFCPADWKAVAWSRSFFHLCITENGKSWWLMLTVDHKCINSHIIIHGLCSYKASSRVITVMIHVRKQVDTEQSC